MKWDSIDKLLKVKASHKVNNVNKPLGTYIIAIYNDHKNCDIFLENEEGNERRKHPQLIKLYTIDKKSVKDYLTLIDDVYIDNPYENGLIKTITKNIPLFKKDIFVDDIELLDIYGKYMYAREKLGNRHVKHLPRFFKSTYYRQYKKLIDRDKLTKYPKYEIYYINNSVAKEQQEVLSCVITKRKDVFTSRTFNHIPVDTVYKLSCRIRNKESIVVTNKKNIECTILYAKPVIE